MNKSYLYFLLMGLCLLLNNELRAQDNLTTITWPFALGTEGQTATFADGAEANFSADWVGNGSNLFYKSYRTDGAITYTQFNPTTQTALASEIDLVSFNVRPKTGLNFTPVSIAFDAIRVGTDGGYIDVYWKSADGTLTALAAGIQAVRNGKGSDPHMAFDLTSLSVPASGGDCALYIYIYNLGNTKQVGLANIVINGNVSGTAANIATYNLQALVSPAGAGTVTTTPVGSVFDQGTTLTLTAATRNFGYQFKEWQDGSGTILSSTSPYTFNIAGDATVVAVYDEITTYSFDVEILGSKWGKVSLTPEPTNGKYEAGTTVLMEVVPNPVSTFGYWDDSSTATGRTVVVDGNKLFAATFDEIPFIAGWDFNPTTPNSSRAGDYYSETANTGLLNVYKQDGSTISWLGHAGAFSPKVPCSYLWTTEALFAGDRRYWIASFSTLNYQNILVKSQMAGANQHYLTQKMQYSTDGVNYTDLKAIDVSASAWTDLNETLPVACEGRERVYIRWIADTNSTLVSPGAGNDGTAITNIFVFADKVAVNDHIPPVLISSVPSEEATNATASGAIVLTFDERMKAGTGACTLAETALNPTFGSKTVTFAYRYLSYNTDYTFTVPASALTDMNGNAFEGVTIHFKTMERAQPTAGLFDAVVATDGTGDYLTIKAAIDAAPTNNALPYLIFVKNGEYRGHIDIPANKPFIHLIGQERDSVIISDARLAGSAPQYPDSTVYHVSQGATVVVNSNDCYFENITFENRFGYDNVSGPQALALYTIGDKIILKNCWLRSYQDTYLTTYSNPNYRHYLETCRIEGAVDFIYGGGNVFFDRDTIYCTRPSNGYIVAPSHAEGTKWGYVFSNCVVDGIDGTTTYLGRPWHNAPKTSFFNTTFKINIYPVGWYYKMGAIPAIFADYNSMDAGGNPLDISQRIDTYEYVDSNGNTVVGTAKKAFTDEEAAQYTYENVVSGTDNWNPRMKTESAAAPEISFDNGTLSWSEVDYAICYVVTCNSAVVGFTAETTFTDENYSVGSLSKYQVQAVAEYGSLSEYSNTIATTIDTSTDTNTDTETGVSTVENTQEKVWVYVDNSTLMVRNIKPGSKIALYSLTGALILSDRAVGDYYSTELNVKQGIYILRVDSEAIKVKL